MRDKQASYLGRVLSVVSLVGLTQLSTSTTVIELKRWGVLSISMISSSPAIQVGIDRAASEWVLRCGGGLTYNNGQTLRDYNGLPVGKYR